MILVKQDPIRTTIKSVCCIYSYGYQAGAAIERIVPDAGDTTADDGIGQAGAVSERR